MPSGSVMFHATVALLRLRQLADSKHGALRAAFGREFVATGLFSREHHAAWLHAFEGRQLADYGFGPDLTEERVRQGVERGEAFVRQAEAFPRDHDQGT